MDPEIFDLLRLTLTPDLGPIRIRRLIERFGSARAVINASSAELASVKLGNRCIPKPDRIVEGLRQSAAKADVELELARKLGIQLLAIGSGQYPALLTQIPDPPPLLYVRGTLDPNSADRYPVAIVGSRHCTAYGIEQAERFASVLAQAGLTIVSGGARGIDTAAHRGALRGNNSASGRTVAVLGCGLAHAYPPENQPIFEEIAASRGAVVSELPLQTPPTAENFPARNRIISGLSLGVIVVEAGERSGALITARLAAEEHGREVLVIPGRVDSAASAGSHELLKQGGATLITSPGDVIAALESPARHHFGGTHAARFEVISRPVPDDDRTESEPALPLFDATPTKQPEQAQADPLRAAVLGALAQPATPDELLSRVQASPARLRSLLTMLEIERRIVREGSRLRLR